MGLNFSFWVLNLAEFYLTKRMQCEALKHATLNVREVFTSTSSRNCRQMRDLEKGGEALLLRRHVTVSRP